MSVPRIAPCHNKCRFISDILSKKSVFIAGHESRAQSCRKGRTGLKELTIPPLISRSVVLLFLFEPTEFATNLVLPNFLFVLLQIMSTVLSSERVRNGERERNITDPQLDRSRPIRKYNLHLESSLDAIDESIEAYELESFEG